jgi:hypothetical protein
MAHFIIAEQTTREHLAARYRELAKQHHPDAGGDAATMQEVNAEYKTALETLSARHLPVLIPKPNVKPSRKPTKAQAPPPQKTTRIKATKKRASPKHSGKREKTLVDFLADVVILGAEYVKGRGKDR